MHRLTDEDLAERVQDDDEDAWRELSFRYRALVYHNMGKYYINGGEKEDIHVIVLAGLYGAATTYKYNPEVPFAGWARHMIHLRMVNTLKYYNSRKANMLNAAISFSQETEKGEIVELSDLFDNNTLDPHREVMRSVMGEELKDRVKGLLSPFEWNVIWMFSEGYSYKEICHSLNTNTKAVDNAISRVKKKAKGSEHLTDLATNYLEICNA